MEIKDGKLIQLLSKIEESELKLLIKFAKSPYHNTNKLIVQLLQKILNYYPDFDHKRLTKEHLYHAIHPEGKAYHEGRMNLLMTNLVSVIQDFYMYQEFQKDKILQRRLKGKAFNNRNLYNYYKKEMEGVLSDLEKSPYLEEEYFFQKYDAQQTSFFYGKEEAPKYLYSAMENLDLFYMLAKLKLAAEQITMAKRLNTSTEITFLEMILLHLEKKNELPVVLNVYNKIIRIRRNENEIEYYKEIKNILFNSFELIQYKTQKLMYLNITNYLVSQLNQGKDELLKELLTLCKFGLKQKYPLENDKMSATSYSTIALIAINAGEFEWSNNFIHDYEKYLPEEAAYLTKLMTLAFWNYKKGVEEDYVFFYKTIKLLREITFKKKNIFQFIRVRLLWIRASYEILKYDLSYYATLMNYIKNFENQLKKDNILSIEVKQRYLFFIFYMRKLIKLSQKKDRTEEDILKLKEEIKNKESSSLNKWIIEKLEEFQTKPLQ